MEQNYTLSDTLKEVREYTFQILDKYSNLNVYTNINLLYRIENNIKTILSEADYQNINFDALFLANYIQVIEQVENKTKRLEFEQKSQYLDIVAQQLNEKFNFNKELIERAKNIAVQAYPKHEAELVESQILSDAIVMDFACNQGRSRLKSFYEQMILNDYDLSKTNWYDILIPFLKTHTTYTSFGKKEVQPLIDKLITDLKKERKEIENNKVLLVQKELKISDEEIKKLKKGLSKIKDRDDRGIQTLFRNTSKNHYKLNQMVDGKARIMITVNAIILSLVIGNVIGKFAEGIPNNIPAIIISIANIISITFAIISITPNRTQGNFTEEEIRGKKGNLLYFGNFYNMHYRDFEWAFLQMLQDKDYLYSSMIKDFYYQGQVLHKKNRAIRVSLYAFLFGLAATIFAHLIITCF